MREDVVDVGLEKGRIDVPGPHPVGAEGLVDDAEGLERLAGAIGAQREQGFEDPLGHQVGDQNVANLRPVRAG